MVNPGKIGAAAAKGGDSSWAWTVYWRADRLQSCLPVSDPAGADDLLAVWRRFFDDLPAGARLLDLGTGNGVVATQAVAVSRTKDAAFEIHGVDLAEIEPASFACSAAGLLREVRFHSKTAMEALPFPDAHFNAVCGQFSLEYSDMERSVPEVLRVLRPGGRFRFLLHADDAVLKGRSRMQRLQAEAIIESPLFERLRTALDGILEAEARPGPKLQGVADSALAAFKETVDELDRGFRGARDRSLPDNLLAAARRLPSLRWSYGRAALLAMADDIEHRLKAQTARLKAMEEAALDADDMEQLIRQFQAAGALEVSVGTAAVGAGATVLGRWLSGQASRD